MKQRALEMPRFMNERRGGLVGERGGPFIWKAEIGRGEFQRNQGAGVRAVYGNQESSSVQIALRLPEADLAQALKIAERKGIGYQTLLKMLAHEGLGREARRVRRRSETP